MMPRYVVEGPYRRANIYDAEGGRAYAEVDAASARAAKVAVARMSEFYNDVTDARADKANPYTRMIAYRYPQHYEEVNADGPTCLVEGPEDRFGDRDYRICDECTAFWNRIGERITALDHRYGY